MPFSTPIFKQQTKEYIETFFDKSWNILDVGAGCGTYADMLVPMGFDRIDAIEIYQPYIEQYSLKTKYKNVYCDNIISSNMDLSRYDAVLLGDVIEHMSIKDSLTVLEKIESSKQIIIGIPFNAPQGEHYGNIYETHIQDKLNNQDFLNLYRSFDIFCLRYDYAIYVKNSKKLNQLYTLDITNEDHQFLQKYYQHRTIINLNESNL